MLKIIVNVTLALCLACGFALAQKPNAAIGLDGAEPEGGGSLTDPRDGKVYRTVKIGRFVWMAENLNYKTGNSWCYGNEGFNCGQYGRLYSWNAAKSACPGGWHLPNRPEWKDLMDAVGGVSEFYKDATYRYFVAGEKLKSKSGWNAYQGASGNGTDDFGFSALPGGCRHHYSGGSFHDVGGFGYWWGAAESWDGAYIWDMCERQSSVHERTSRKSHGYSVRCVKG
ncbi:MAG: fibrobacter succinogenes major paralogous domain-containing protein [Chitinispirillales bacterium]|jgi:uncharacterized protein (TIGR02145 family)|nr:fibrobacter succinogenes major paralogous domain-containing protein [Chitinispirillales bacterium]